MRRLMIWLFFGLFVINIMGKKIFIKRQIVSSLVLLVLSIILYDTWETNTITIVSVLYISFICLIYISFYYFYKPNFHWHELTNSQKWYVGNKIIREGNYNLMSKDELSRNIFEWDLLDRYYKS